MSSVVISGDTSGAITLSAPAVAGTNTATLPAATGTVMVSGNQPAFAVYKSTPDQSITTSTYTKVTFTNEEFDTNNNFASSTFTPTVAGYYQLNWQVDCAGTVISKAWSELRKNGSQFKVGGVAGSGFSVSEVLTTGAALVYANGTTDYFEIYAFVVATSPVIYSSSSTASTWFNGSLVRTA
jgi:hypothetical protein